MSLFTDVADILAHLELCYQLFPWLRGVIGAKVVRMWTGTLRSQRSPDDFLGGNGEKLNLLNVSVMTGYSIRTGRDDALFAHYRRLLRKLEVYLRAFPELPADKRFLEKITNLEGLYFLATMSELSLAYALHQRGYRVSFETKFKLLTTLKKRDIDLSVQTARGNTFHVEVYMPNNLIEADSASELESDEYPLKVIDLKQDDESFELKIRNKLADKFGQDGHSGLNGRVFLAVNKVFMDVLHLKALLAPDTDDFRALLPLLPQGVDGLLVFEDSFESDSSLKIDCLLRKHLSASYGRPDTAKART
ncbi:hypothetical protein HNQ93_004123 [Hymenobacter luteus]|uniref:Uncharacterized protein n=2 Tax=Hymenobacter TaxID=89966 RepID=A0A7W9T5J7_9BACT|nr:MULTISPECIES: hypothetical protein [Hymenobacter]MBB4603583.1 hypothetical protein [Hymenobacter latericoloratus]MBB6061244.1 hypothetical protein [Hymenobacter luteus]